MVEMTGEMCTGMVPLQQMIGVNFTDLRVSMAEKNILPSFFQVSLHNTCVYPIIAKQNF